MKVYVFDEGGAKRLRTSEREITDVLHRVAEGTKTNYLVAAIYLLSRNDDWQGMAVCREWQNSSTFFQSRGKWAFAKRFGKPADLPPRFKLIKLMFGARGVRYPRQDNDAHGWRMRWRTFDDHLAELFAHEMFHFRRLHLGFHKRGGEQSANKWGLQRAKELGFD